MSISSFQQKFVLSMDKKNLLLEERKKDQSQRNETNKN